MPSPEAEGGDRPGEARRLRGERIPHLVGMAVSARLLARDLSQDLASHAAELTDVQALQKILGCDEETAQALAPAMVGWVLERARSIAARCESHASHWMAEAHRAEGRAQTLEEIGARAHATEPAGATPPEG